MSGPWPGRGENYLYNLSQVIHVHFFCFYQLTQDKPREYKAVRGCHHFRVQRHPQLSQFFLD